MIELNKKQLQEAINTLLEKDNGLNHALELELNGMMHGERSYRLKEEPLRGNKANGYREVEVAGYHGSLELKVPRDRLGVFKPVILGLYRQEEAKISELCFELYGKGLTTRQISGVVKKIYGTNLSKSSISLITQEMVSTLEAWRNKPLESHYPVIYLDALHVKVRRGDRVNGEAFYIAMGLKEDLKREILGVYNIPQESASGWKEVLRSLKERGVENVQMMVADGLKGLEQSVHEIFPKADFQKCVVHLKRHILTKVRHLHKAEVAEDLKEVFDVQKNDHTMQKAQTKWKSFLQKWETSYRFLATYHSEEKMSYYLTYLRYDFRVRSMIYSTNWIERLHKEYRRTLKIRNALPTPEAALTLISKVSMDMEAGTYNHPISTFRKDLQLFPQENQSSPQNEV